MAATLVRRLLDEPPSPELERRAVFVLAALAAAAAALFAIGWRLTH